MKQKTKTIFKNIILIVLMICLSLCFFSCSVTFSNTKAAEELTALKDFNIFTCGKQKLFSVKSYEQIGVDPEQRNINIEEVVYRSTNLNQSYDAGPIVMPTSDTYFELSNSLIEYFTNLVLLIHYGYMNGQNIGYNTLICYISDISQMLKNGKLYWVDLLNGVNVDNAFKSDYDNAYCFDLISLNFYVEDTGSSNYNDLFSPFPYFQQVITKNNTVDCYYAIPYKGYYKELNEAYYYKCKNMLIYSNWAINSASTIYEHNLGAYIPFYPLKFQIGDSLNSAATSINASYGNFNYYIGSYDTPSENLWEFSGTGTKFTFTNSNNLKWGLAYDTDFVKTNISQLIEISEGGSEKDIPDTTKTKFKNTFKIILYVLFPATMLMQVIVGAIIAINSNITWQAGIKEAAEIFDKMVEKSFDVGQKIVDDINKAVTEIPHWTKTFKTGLSIALIAILTFFVLYIAFLIYKNRR